MPAQLPDHINETNYNTVLGGLLSARMPGWDVKPQAVATVAAEGGEGIREPDVLAVAPDRTPVAVEAKYQKGNLQLLDAQTREQVGRSWSGTTIDSAAAVLYPDRLARVTGDYIEALESRRDLRFASWRTGPDGKVRFPAEGWLSGGVDALADFIETAADSEHRADLLVDLFSRAVTDAAGILGERFPKMAELVKQESCEQTDQMVSALLLNALIFHYQVAEHHPEIRDPTLLRSQDGAGRLGVLEEWKAILEINYWPIFTIASRLLEAVDSEKTANQLLRRLIETASQMASANAHTIQNLAGQFFGTLLADRKFLASFYTLPAPAALLAELAVSRLDVDWGDEEAVTGLRIADFACGTGALLSSSYRRIQSRVRRRGIDDASLHRRMLEDVFVGCDIMPAAVHITAATLSSAHPSVDYTKTETHVMPFGPDEDDPTDVKAGSLDLLALDTAPTLFGDGTEAVTARGENGSQLSVPHRSCDLVIMNPPYTSPTNFALKAKQATALPQFAAFGMDKKAQRAIGNKVKKMASDLKVSVRNGYAGLGTDFFDLAHLKVKPGGVIAFVLPASLATGVGWKKLRDLLASEYKNVMVITCSSGQDEHRRFSSDTKMAEALLVATRRKYPADESNQDEDWQWVNLDQNPKTVAEALAIAADLARTDTNDIQSGSIGNTSYGFSVRCRRSKAPVMIRSPEVAEALLSLTNPDRPGINLPRFNEFIPLPLTRLGNLGTKGPVHRSLVRNAVTGSGGPFNFLPHPGGRTEFPALWSHDHLRETRLTVHPDQYGIPVKGRESRAAELWQTATCLHFNLDFDFGSQPLATCLTPEPVLGGRAWPSFRLHNKDTPPPREQEEWLYPIVLWANSTLGLMSFYITGTRTQKRRSTLTISRLPELPVLNVRQLTPDQLSLAETIFHRFRNRELMPANMANQDLTRQDLDQAVLIELLELDLDVLKRVEVIRDQWCREPHLWRGK